MEIDYLKQSKMQNTYNPVTGSFEEAFTKAQFMTHVYSWMALGLVLTGFVAVITYGSPAIWGAVFGSPLLYVLLIAEIALVFAFSAAVRRNVAMPVLIGMFLGYSALNGVTLAVVLLVYTAQSVASTFFITASMFAALAAFGIFTKKDLSVAGRFAFMALWGIIIASLVNLFMQSSGMSFLISFAGVGIFSVLTAYDSQKLSQLYDSNAYDEAALKRLGLMGALTLYLDFINLFLHLLRFLGDRRR